jgi:tetratricopeptide (TPR) repeat protein
MRVLLCFVLGALLLSADVVDAKKKKKKAKKKSSRVVKSTANVAIENQLADIAQMTHLVDQIDALDRLIVQKPKEPRYWLARGQARLKKDFLPSAMKDFDQVISLDPEFEGPGRLAMVSKADILKRKPEGLSTALQLMVTLAEELDQPFYEGVMKRCELLARMQKWADAIPLCGDIIDSPHKDDYSWNDDALGWAYFYRAQAYEAQHSFKQARTDYDGCIASWAHLPPLNKGNVVNATVAQRQLRTAHFNRADLRCAGQCGFNGAGAGSPTAELRDEIDMDGAVADYEVVANHALTQPGAQPAASPLRRPPTLAPRADAAEGGEACVMPPTDPHRVITRLYQPRGDLRAAGSGHAEAEGGQQRGQVLQRSNRGLRQGAGLVAQPWARVREAG